MAAPLRIGLICSHSLVRDMLSDSLISRGHSPVVIDPISTGDPGTTSIHGRCSGCSVIVVCGWGMTRGGHQVVRHLASVDSRLRIVLVESSSDRSVAEVALRTGATAVIGADASLSATLEVIEAAARGDSHVDLSTSTHAAGSSSTSSGALRTVRPPSLTLRETEILQLVVDGLDVNQISERLYIGSKTVKHHLSSIYMKLGATNRTRAVVHGLKRGLVELPTD